jgi:MFS transporter, DHA1 family, multidrug resistance protein
MNGSGCYPARMPAPPVSTRRLALILGALAMFGPFAIDTLFPAFPDVARDFAVTPLAMQQTISAYLVAYAFMGLFHGPLSDAFGRKPVILVGTVVFGLASIGCALSENLPELLAFRALQGLSAGVGLIVGRAIIRDCLDGDAAQRLMAGVSMIFSIAPAIAPIIGGWIIGFADWPWIFWFLALFSLALFVVVALLLPETHPVAERTPIAPRQLAAQSMAMLRNPLFLRLALAGGFNFSALFLYIASAPAFVLGILNLNAQQFGWFFVPTITGMMLGSFASGRLAGRISREGSVQIGFAISALSALVNLSYTWLVEEPALPWAVVPMAINAFGIALVFPILTLKVLDLYPRQRGAVSSMQAVVGLGINAAVAGLLSPWVSHSAWMLALVSAASIVVAWFIWRSYLRQRALPVPR